MSTINVPSRYPIPIKPERAARNSKVADFNPLVEIGRDSNFALCHCRKQVFTVARAPESAALGSEWHWYCRTGDASTTAGKLKLRAFATMLPGSSWCVRYRNASTGTTVSGVASTGGETPGVEGVLTQHQFSDYTFRDLMLNYVDVEVEPNTEYECMVETIDGRRPVTMSVYEVHPPFVDSDDAVTIDVSPLRNKGAITSATASGIVSAPHELWKHNGAHLFNCFSPIGDVSYSIQSSTDVNIEDSNVTAVADDSPGFTLATHYLNAEHTDNVTVRFAAYGFHSVGNSGEVKLVTASGTLATLSGFQSEGSGMDRGEWKVATVSGLDGSVDTQKVDIHANNGGSGTLKLHTISLFLYEE